MPKGFQLNLPLLVYLRKLGELSFDRYKSVDGLDDLRMCIHAMRDASYLIADENLDKPSVLTFFSKALRFRFERTSFSPDLDEAILSLSQAVTLTPDDAPEKIVRLLALVSTLYARFKMTRDTADLEEAIKLGARVLELTPDDHPERPTRLNSHAVSLQARFERSGTLPDLQEAVKLKTLAVEITPNDHPDMPAQLSNLAISLVLRFQRIQSIADLERAIDLQTRAVESTPEGHPDRTVMFRGLGRSFRTRLNSKHAKPDDLTQARRSLLCALQEKTGYPDWRLRAGLEYVDLLSHPTSPTSSKHALLQAYEHALNLIPPLMCLGGNFRRRDDQPIDLAALYSRAAADAIVAGDYDKALEWLENGRTTTLTQVLRTATPLDNLRKDHAQLASELQHAYQALLDASLPKCPMPIDDVRPQTSLETQAETTRNLALKYESLLVQVRELEGLENFMCCRKLAQLSEACTTGPVVFINVHESRCDALVLHHPGKVAHVPLPAFSYDHAKKLRQQLSSALRSASSAGGFRNGSKAKGEKTGIATRSLRYQSPDLMYFVLADLWKLVVKPIIDVLKALVSTLHRDYRGQTNTNKLLS